jgi:translation initiation factor eIF-2B subunit alpha
MKTASTHSLYHLILEDMRLLGTSRTTIVAISASIDAIQRLKSKDSTLMRSVLELNDIIRHTQPKVMPLVHLIDEFEMELRPYQDKPLNIAKKAAVEILEKKLKSFEAATRNVTEQCMSRIASKDFIIAHSPTGYLRDAFVQAHSEFKRPFKVLILKNDFFRTKELINALEQNHVPHRVIPEYNLSHFLTRTNKLFISAVTLTSDYKAVTGVGTANVVSLCRWHHVPVYLFVESIKFAPSPLTEQHIHIEREDKIEAGFTFHMTTFSHDVIDLGMVDHLITENGEISPPKKGIL